MKKTIQFASLTALAAIWGGCAGYNTTMFMTKSNAGLDIDMKPPTAEINISRKEAVIEPAFEKGQTPPVMASFKPKVGWGRFGNYFLGVDQTFAGGDAALTMAMLYDSTTPTSVTNGQFDSTLTVTNQVKKQGWFWSWIVDPLFTPAEPDQVRPFIFGTDTQLGLKVAWSGAGGQFPDTVKAGFNRKEFAWAPVTMYQDRTKIKMPSFLATIESNTGGGSETNEPAGTNGPPQPGSIRSIQYFSTGEAASHLARQQAVRVAMLKRLDPHSETAAKVATLIQLAEIAEYEAATETAKIESTNTPTLNLAISSAKTLSVISSSNADVLTSQTATNGGWAKQQLIGLLKAGSAKDIENLNKYTTVIKQLN